MREIKFRAWDRVRKEMVYPDSLYVFEEMGIRKLGNDINEWDGDCDWMQFTGYKDKNGKEIYEGDIFQLTTYPEGSKHIESGKIVGVKWGIWDGGDMECETWFFFPEYYSNSVYDDHDCGIVIGNIYENPELCAASQAQ